MFGRLIGFIYRLIGKTYEREIWLGMLCHNLPLLDEHVWAYCSFVRNCHVSDAGCVYFMHILNIKVCNCYLFSIFAFDVNIVLYKLIQQVLFCL